MRVAAIGADRGTVKIIELSNGGQVGKATEVKVEDTDSAITSLDFGKDPELLVVSTQNSHVWVLNWTTGASRPAVGQHATAYRTAFSPDGRHIAAASADGVLRVWSIENLNRPFVLRGHKGLIYSLQFTQDGQTLVSASADGTIRMWSMDCALGPQLGGSLPQESNTGARESSVPKDESEVARAVSRDGYTAVAYNGSPTHLALFGPDSNEVTRWGGRINVQWRSVAFEDQGGTQAIVAVSKAGKVYSWPYFKNLKDLIKFADDHIPFYGSNKLELPADELCKLGPNQCNNIGD